MGHHIVLKREVIWTQAPLRLMHNKLAKMPGLLHASAQQSLGYIQW